MNYDIVYGLHPLLHLLKAGRRKLYKLQVMRPEPAAFKQIKALLPSYCEVLFASRDYMNKLAGGNDHQGLIGYAAPLPLRSKPFDPKHYPFVVLLDSIQDVRNLGAIIRSASCTNVSGIIMGQKNTAPLQAPVYKAAAGLIEDIPVRIVASALAAAQELQAAGYTLYGAALPGKDAMQVSYTAPCALVIGNEGTGISSSILPLCNSVMIPQRNPDISYNASVAAGILCFHIAKKIGCI